MAASKWCVFPVAALLAASIAGCSDDAADKQVRSYASAVEQRVQHGQALMMRSAMQDYLDAKSYPWKIRQAEFQDASDGRWWVVQLDDPVELSTDPLMPVEQMNADVLGMVKAGVSEGIKQSKPRMEAVSNYIVAFRDPLQTVFEIPPEVMDRFVSGELAAPDVLEESTITTLK